MPRLRSTLASGLFLFAALLLFASPPMSWGGGEATDGTRYKLSPLQLSHVLKPHQTVSPTEDCRIFGANRCQVAPGGEAAFARFRLVYPLTIMGIAACLLVTLFGLFPALAPPIRVATGLAAALLPVAAMTLFSVSARPALEGLTNTDFGLAATLGTMLLILAIALALGGTGLILFPRLRGGHRAIALAALLALPFIGLRLGGWPGVAAAFGLGLLAFITLSVSFKSLPPANT
jgi:hypothetical protein